MFWQQKVVQVLKVFIKKWSDPVIVMLMYHNVISTDINVVVQSF